jgi:hypothetical protein
LPVDEQQTVSKPNACARGDAVLEGVGRVGLLQLEPEVDAQCRGEARGVDERSHPRRREVVRIVGEQVAIAPHRGRRTVAVAE